MKEAPCSDEAMSRVKQFYAEVSKLVSAMGNEARSMAPSDAKFTSKAVVTFLLSQGLIVAGASGLTEEELDGAMGLARKTQRMIASFGGSS